MRFRTGIALLLLGLAAVLAYAPSLAIPLMEDDYPNLAQTLNGGLATPLADPIFRVRATSFWTMWLLWRWAGLAPLAYHATSLLLHIANTWLLYGVCMAWPRMRTAAFWAAGFFAIAEGHQEAVMWFSAVNELWLFLFGMAALLCFLRRRTAAGLALFALALLSKESAAAVLPPIPSRAAPEQTAPAPPPCAAAESTAAPPSRTETATAHSPRKTTSPLPGGLPRWQKTPLPRTPPCASAATPCTRHTATRCSQYATGGWLRDMPAAPDPPTARAATLSRNWWRAPDKSDRPVVSPIRR